MKLLVDGCNLAFRANKTKHLTTKQGERVGAIFGTLQMLQSYIKPTQPKFKNKIYEALKEIGIEETFSRVIVAWDYGASNFRKAIYPDYKGQRKKKRDNYSEEQKQEYKDLMRQMDELYEFLPSLGVHSIRKKGWEADDLLYVASRIDDDICVIVSTDRDLLQAVDERTFIWSPTKEELITPYNFLEKVGVPKTFYMDYRVLVGDPSDNIDGIPGIGDKTAKSLVAKYGGIPNMLRNRETLMKSARTRKIFENLHIIDRNKDIMCLSLIPISEVEPFIKEELAKTIKINDERVKEFFIRKQFASMLRDYIGWTQPFRTLS